jgi:hypothetical protein
MRGGAHGLLLMGVSRRSGRCSGSGIVIEDYQLEPLVRARRSPRTNLLIADDAGLDTTVEGGLVVQELLSRHPARTAVRPLDRGDCSR